jgi:type VI secretion system secreted protein VgrG
MTPNKIRQFSRLELAGSEPLEVRRFAIEDRMSSLFEVRIEAVSSSTAPPFDEIVGHAASFSLREPHLRSWVGVCRSIAQVKVEARGLSTYEVSLVPALWMATQRRNHRMFQQISDPDIVLQLLGEWGIQPQIAFDRAAHKTRKYRVQYGESDYAFLSRLLEDAGLSFYFLDGSQMVIADAPEKNEARQALPFAPEATAFFDRETVTEVAIERQVRPGSYAIRDHDYRRAADYPLLSQATLGNDAEQRLERFHYVPGAFLFGAEDGAAEGPADDRGITRHLESEGERIARRRLDAKRGAAQRVRCTTTAFDLCPGVVFSLADHPSDMLREDRRLLVLSTVITGGATEDWSHRCEAVGAELPHRPTLKTDKPRTQGVESATVVGPEGEEIHCDEFGRIRVHFHWDRESAMNDKSSCWIPVSQPWSGTGFGGTNLPRIGQEVLVDFLGGDPDRPVVTGRVYTNVNKTPYKLPDNKTQSGWRSMSSPGGDGFNEMMFEDKKGQERLNMQAERNMDTLVKNDQTLAVGKDRSVAVKRHLDETIGVSQRTMVGTALLTTVGVISAEQVGLIKRIDVGDTLEVTVGKSKLIMKKNGDITLRGRSILIEGAQVKVIGDPIELN